MYIQLDSDLDLDPDLVFQNLNLIFPSLDLILLRSIFS